MTAKKTAAMKKERDALSKLKVGMVVCAKKQPGKRGKVIKIETHPDEEGKSPMIVYKEVGGQRVYKNRPSLLKESVDEE